MIFLTSFWESFYIEAIGINNKNKSIKWGNYQTRYQKYNNRLFIRSMHPQGKPEALHVDTIIKCIREMTYEMRDLKP